MITQEQWTDISQLLETGYSVPQVSLQTGVSIPTIYRLKDNNGPKIKLRKNKGVPKKILKYKEYLDSRLRSNVRNGEKLLNEIKELGYKGSYASLNRYLKVAIPDLKYQNYKPAIRYETEPGEQALVDWGHFGIMEINGRREKLYCFVYVLGYSRAAYIEFTTRQNLITLEECHIHAFQKLGIPKEVVYDNMKTVVTRVEKLPGGSTLQHLNPAYLDFAKFYGFKVNPTAPYWPRAKGKVESGVKYVRRNFMLGMKFKKGFSSLEDLNIKATIWLNTIANDRTHGTTGEKPSERWSREKPALRFPSDFEPYPTASFVTRMSTKDCLVQYKSNFYSVPIEFARRKVLLKEANDRGIISLRIYHEDQLIATHLMSRERGKWIVEDKHLIQKINFNQNTQHKLAKKSKAAKDKPTVYTRSLEYYDRLIRKSI